MNILFSVVSTSTGIPMQGVSVTSDGNVVGVTDANGNINLTNLTGVEEITFAYVGYPNVTVASASFRSGSGQIHMGSNVSNAIVPSGALSPAPEPTNQSILTTEQTPVINPYSPPAGPVVLSPDGITPAIVTTAPGPNWLLLGAVGVGAYLLLKPKKGKTSGLGKITKTQGGAIALGVVAVGGLYLFMQGKTNTTTIITPGQTATGGGYIPAAASSLVPGSAVPVVNQAGGILSSLAKLFTGPAPTAQQTAQSASPSTDQITDLPAAYQSPANAYSSLPTGVPAAPIAAPLPQSGMTDEQYADEYNDAMSGFIPKCDTPLCKPGVPKIFNSSQVLGGIPLLPGMAVAGIGSYMLMRKKKTVGDTTMDVLLIGGLMVGGYLIYESIFGGTSPNTANNQNIAASTVSSNAQSLAASIAAGVPQTLSTAQVNSLATDIYNQCQSGNAASNELATDAAQQQILTDLLQINNATDFYAIMVAFGSKSSCIAFSMGCQQYTMDSMIKAVCSPSTIALINQEVFANLSIQYSF